MPKWLEGGIAKQVARGLRKAGMTLPATLIKVTAGTRTPGAISAGTNPTETSHKARGFVPKKTAKKIGGTIVEENDRIVALLGATLASGVVPTSKDKLTIDGETLRVMAVETDAAKAVYTCLCRK